MKKKKSDYDFFIIFLDEYILAIDEKVFGNTIGELMKNHRGIQFFWGTMFFQGDDAAIVMTIPTNEARRNHINGMETLRNGYSVLTVDKKASIEEREQAMDFVIHFIVNHNKAKKPLKKRGLIG